MMYFSRGAYFKYISFIEENNSRCGLHNMLRTVNIIIYILEIILYFFITFCFLFPFQNNRRIRTRSVATTARWCCSQSTFPESRVRCHSLSCSKTVPWPTYTLSNPTVRGGGKRVSECVCGFVWVWVFSVPQNEVCVGSSGAGFRLTGARRFAQIWIYIFNKIYTYIL